jgi:hypothetical protein
VPWLSRGFLRAYLAGLQAAGWREDPRLVRLGMWSPYASWGLDCRLEPTGGRPR